MYTALYRRYRPSTFDEMAGQGHVVKILRNQIKTGNTAHAYLFCGTRGTGKTSAARIFAKGVNCLSAEEKPCGKCENCVSIQSGTFFDVIEIDAASNNGVDNIRELRESVKYPPAAGLCKVYIIDEVHMLSQGAFNALLKTLEEPPAHVIFILATTEPHKLPATILSRCLRLDFRRVSEKDITDKLRQICEELEIPYEENALSLIASAGDGSVRDSLSILEQCMPADMTKLTRKSVVEVLGTAGEEVFIEITQQVTERNAAEALLLIERISEEGKDLRQFTRDWIFHLRNLLMSKFAGKLDTIMNMSCENTDKVKAQGQLLNQAFISGAISELSNISNQMRWSTQPRTLIELSIFKLSSPEMMDNNLEFLVQRIEKLEHLYETHQYDVKNSDKVHSVTKAEEKTFTNLDEKLFPDESAVSSMDLTEGSPQIENAATSQKPNTFDNNGRSEAVNLWETAFGKAISDKPSLNMLKGNLMASGMDEKSITLEASSEVMKRYTEQNKEFLEKLLKELTGKELRIEINLSDRKEGKADSQKTSKTMDQTIGKLNELLGSDKLNITD